jgi:tRNA (uracil-5-)-methyltransferase TRM9
MDSVRSLIRPLRLTRPNAETRCARFLIYVWAFEQGENSKRKMGVLAPLQDGPKSEEQDTMRQDEEKETRQDVMVPWVLQPKPIPKAKVPKTEKKHRGRRGEASEPIPESPAAPQDPPTEPQPVESQPAAEPPQPQVFHRYYHLFVKGELATLVQDAGRAEGFTVVDSVPTGTGEKEGGKWLRVVEEGYEKDNWWLEGEVGLY